MSNIKPLRGYIIVEPEKQETTTISGIVLPKSVENKPQTGRVTAVGARVMSDAGFSRKCPVEVNDIIIYRDWSGKQYKDGDNELLILKFEDVMAVITK